MKNRYYIIIALLTLVVTSCHREELNGGLHEVRFRLFAKEHISVSRGYKLLGTQEGDTTLANFTAGLFITTGDNCFHSTMTWNGNTMSAGTGIESGDYSFYSYIPYDKEASFADNTLTLNNIHAIGGMDIMVANSVVTKEVTSNVSIPLYMDHLMARVSPYIYVHGKYAAMRTIKIKKVEMVMRHDTLYTAEVDVDDNDDYSVAWTKGEAAMETTVTTYESETPDTLSINRGEQEYGCCYLCPAKWTGDLCMRVTYDVYDTEDCLTRKDAVVENQIKRLPDWLTAGTNYRLHIKIVPTYLYALSDNDNGTEILIVETN